jgi:hypothetical protein
MRKVHQRKPSRRHPTHAAPERCARIRGLRVDRGYDFDKYRRLIRTRGITPMIARSGTPHRSGPGKTRVGRQAHLRPAPPVQTTPHPLRDTHRPPPSPAPTRLHHPLFETTSNLILKRSVTPSRDSTLGRGAGPAGAESPAGSAGRTASVPPRALRIVDLGAGDHAACKGNAGPAAALGRRAGRGPCDDVSLQRSSARATHCLEPGADDPAPFLLPFANPNGESG